MVSKRGSIAQLARFLFFCINFLLIFFVFFSFVSAQSQTKIDQGVLKILEKNQKVEVTIILGDSNGSKNQNTQLRSEILSNFTEKEFELKWESSSGRGFQGNITLEGLNKLSNNPNVLRVYLPIEGSTTLQQSLPLIGVNPDVWNLGYTGKGQTVCVIDSGVNYSNSNLGGCTQSQFLNGTCTKILGGYNFVNDTSNPMDDNGHGTHVSGIVAANGSIKGVAPDAKLVVVKVSNSNGIWGETDLVDGIDWCNSHKNTYNISVITMSLGSFVLYNNKDDCDNSAIGDAVNNAHNNGIFIDASSGNNGNLTHLTLPACASNVVSVGAIYDGNVGVKVFCLNDPCTQTCRDDTTQADQITCFSNRGNLLDLLAPGSVIDSVPSSGSNSCSDGSCSGTSQAAPHVAGTAALLLQRDPTLSPDKIQQILNDTGVRIWDPVSQRNYYRIDALAAIQSLCTCTSWTAGSCGAGTCLDSEKSYTRTCNPSACDIETKCEYESSCNPIYNGIDITVCASGCNYTTITNAVANSNLGDKIFVTDNRTYSEDVILDSGTSYWLDCQAGATISGTGETYGVRFKHITNELPVVVGCNIKGFTYGIYVNSSYGLFQNNTITNCDTGIYFRKQIVNGKIKNNNVTGCSTYGIWFDSSSWSDSSTYSKVENNIIKNSGVDGIFFRYGQNNEIRNNKIFGSSSVGSYGVHLSSSGSTAFATINDNSIYENYNGLYFQGANDNIFNSNMFCSSNSNLDIDIGSSSSISGDNNRCEKPGSWNDAGTTGCTYYCDTPATVILLYPYNNSIDSDGNVSLICQSSDDYQLINVTLYHNITGTWYANETKNISGTSNITTFNINNIPNGGSFIWNCFSYDNKSRGSFANSNWSVNINITYINVHDLIEIYSNSTQRTFGFFIQNLNSSNLTNVSWKLNTGQTNITSQFNSTLQSNQSKYVIVEYNYSASGNYVVTATAFSNGISGSESIEVSV